MAILVHVQERLTTRVHLNVTKDPVDIEAREWEDLGELSTILELCLQEENFALSSANMAIMCHDVAPLIHHETSLVNIDLVSVLITPQQELDVAIAVTIEHSHDLLQLKRLPIVVEQFRQKATKLTEL